MKNYEFNLIKENKDNIITLFFQEKFVEDSRKKGFSFYLNNDDSIIKTKNGIVVEVLVPTKKEKELIKKARFVYIVDEKSNIGIVLKLKNQNLRKELDKYIKLE